MGRRNELIKYTLHEALSFPSDLADLRDEMTEWQSNMEGASMEHLPKYEEVTECVDAMDDAVSTLETACDTLIDELSKADVALDSEGFNVPTDQRKRLSRSQRLANAIAPLSAAIEHVSGLNFVDEGGTLDEITQALDELSNVSFPGAR